MSTPYTVGNFVRTTDFYGRQTLIDDLLSPGNTHTYLVGNRRIGKTSLLHFLADHSLDVALFVSLQGAGTDAYEMASNLYRSLKLQFKHYPQYQTAFTEIMRAAPGDMGEAIDLLGQVAEAGQFDVLLLLDEAEKLLSLNLNELDRLRRAFEEQPRIRVVLAATRKLAILFSSDGDNSAFLDGFRTIYLSILSDEEARSLICQTKKNLHLNVSDELIGQICEITGKHPYLIQTLCDRLFQPDGDGSLRSIQEKDLALELQLLAFCKQEYDVLSPSEREILSCVAKHGQLEYSVLAKLPEFSKIKLSLFLPTLERLGLLCIKDSKYKVGNNFFKKWLLEQVCDDTPGMVSDQVSRDVANQASTPFIVSLPALRQKEDIPYTYPDAVLVRVFDDSKRTVGAGFLIAKRHILTCAHVVAAALKLDNIPVSAPGTKITLDFPFLAIGQYVEARVTNWQPPFANEECGDIAVLELSDDPPDKACPAQLLNKGDMWGHPFRVFGFPAGYDQGVWASGRILAFNPAGRLQVEDVKQTGYFIQPGFSGGPVWDDKQKGIVGMLVSVDRSPVNRVAFVIPYKLLEDFVPNKK